MRLGETPAQRIGDAAELFPHGHLLDHAQVASAVRGGHIHRADSPSSIANFLWRFFVSGGEVAFVELRFDFERNELVGRELRRAFAPLQSRLIQFDIHGLLTPSRGRLLKVAAETRPPGTHA